MVLVPAPGTGTTEPPRSAPYFDIAALLAGDLPEPPKPTVMRRSDGLGIFYAEQLNLVFGDPECGKTWLLLCAGAQVLLDGGRFLFIDLDHNGAVPTATRLLNLGVPVDVLSDLDRFRYIEPADPIEMHMIVGDCETWSPDLTGLDSLGELLPMFRASSNSGDDFTSVHSRIIKPLVRTGACVVLIDHLAKGMESRQSGPTGSPAKRRAVGGVSLRVRAKDAFVPGHGGTAYLMVNKDRHGGLRAGSPTGDREPLAGVFTLKAGVGDELAFTLRPAQQGEQAPADHAAPDLVEKIAALSPPPKSANDAANRIGGNRKAALAAFREWQESGTGSGTGTGTGTTSEPPCPVCRFPMSFADDLAAGHHLTCTKENC
ncbi:recombinase RecA [Gordonia alkanivorans]|uniref:recombinase RecA n=1 Tax=Gordonia alkanivorans TaxID=84096 RepID=UPI001F4D6946|nr:recombinase RecA [Gordonia alkanivorans]MDH3026835.1 recombinase RecA [Gordonia alkanivorans]